MPPSHRVKTLVLLLFATLLSLAGARAQDANTTAVLAADDVRIAAMKAGDREKLTAIFSDELHYAHSNGKVDTKATFVEALSTGQSRYLKLEPKERKVTFASPEVALISGLADIQVASAKGETVATLSYLAAWRQENGQWRFLAWQSCRMPPPTP